MLTSLSIKNIALIDDLSIELGKGLNCITGETGAGKSLIIDSISLLLGERADKSLISHGKDYAYVEAVFETQNNAVLDAIENFGLERENTIIISRKISLDGRNECRVNGKVFTLSMLKKITLPLMDLHGQFEHQTLLLPSNHIKVLDNFGSNDILPFLSEIRTLIGKLKDIKSELSSYTIDASERLKLIDLYKFQIDEIESAAFKVGEEEELKEFRIRVLHEEKIISSIKNALDIFNNCGYGSSSLLEMIGRINGEISGVSNYIEELKGISERMDSIRYEINDIVDNLESIQNNLYFNEFEAEANEKRLDLLSSIKKKYGNNIEEINLYLEKIKKEYNKLITSEETIELLQCQKEKIERDIIQVSEKLTNARKKSAQEFENLMTHELISLGMKDAKFIIDIKPISIENINENGLDQVEFLFSANLGQDPLPLSKIASGGEMSRLMLSIKNIAGMSFGVDTMIFDEIDTGVSGYIAGVIAQKLSIIAHNHQVICVTHLSQIASYGNKHFYIEKNIIDNKTKTTVQEIDGDARVGEIARLIGGKITQHSILHAKEMLSEGFEFYKNFV